MQSPAVSLILPTQGRRPLLRSALESALRQTFASFEIVVVDDAPLGEEWRSGAAIAPLLADGRVRVVPFHQGRSAAAAKNAGVRAARGEWVCYLDDDNEYLPDKIAAQWSLATTRGAPLVLCGLTILANGRRRIHQARTQCFSGDELLLAVQADTNVLFHRRESAPAWDEDLGTVDDACFFQALVARFGLREVPNVPRPLVIYRSHAGDRANRALQRFYPGQRRLLVRWGRRYSRAARRLLLLRSLVAFEKYREAAWGRFVPRGVRLLREGGPGEIRFVVNAAAVKLPLVRRWMVT